MIDWKGRGMEGYDIGPRKTRAKDPHMLNYAAQYHLASASQLRGHECGHGQWLSCDPCATWLLGILSVHQVSRPMSFIYWLIFLSLVPLPFSDSLIAFPLQDLLVPCPFSSVQFSVSCSFGFFFFFFLSDSFVISPSSDSLVRFPFSGSLVPSSFSLVRFPYAFSFLQFPWPFISLSSSQSISQNNPTKSPCHATTFLSVTVLGIDGGYQMEDRKL